jgi:predicted flap endonuclease-1-like 5' DNA nuclease
LIDTPPAAAMAPPPIVPPASAGTMAGMGEIVAHAARKEVQAVETPETPVQTSAPAPIAPIAPIAPAEAPQPMAGGTDEKDDLRKTKGVGPKLVATLHALGINRYAQIAAWTDADLDSLDAQLGAFAGRPRRDSWVEQARLLSSGDTADYEAKFGKL